MLTKSLSPEEKRAIQKLCKSLPSLRIQSCDSATSDIYIDGNVSMFELPFTTRCIPSDKWWRWNQTKSQKKVELQGRISVMLAKLIPRKSNIKGQLECKAVPHYKIWQYVVSVPLKEPAIVFWCEKGTNPNRLTESSALDDMFSDVAPSPPTNRLYATKISFICN